MMAGTAYIALARVGTTPVTTQVWVVTLHGGTHVRGLAGRGQHQLPRQPARSVASEFPADGLAADPRAGSRQLQPRRLDVLARPPAPGGLTGETDAAGGRHRCTGDRRRRRGGPAHSVPAGRGDRRRPVADFRGALRPREGALRRHVRPRRSRAVHGAVRGRPGYPGRDAPVGAARRLHRRMDPAAAAARAQSDSELTSSIHFRDAMNSWSCTARRYAFEAA